MKWRAALVVLACLGLKGDATESRLTAYFFGPDSYADVVFPGVPGSAERVTASTTDSHSDTGLPIEVLSVEPLGGRPRTLRVLLADAPPQDHQSLRVCFGKIAIGGSPRENLCVEGQVVREASLAKQEILARLAASAKTQSEKDLFASGFLNGNAAAVELDVNRGDLGAKAIQYFLRLKRSTASDTDPRHAEAGFRWRRILLARRAQAAGAVKNHLIAGYLVDAGAKVEGDAAARAVNAALGYASFGIQSGTKSVHPLAGGQFRFRLAAAGLESGEGKTRIRAGADATLSLRRAKPEPFLRHFELHAETSGRYLLRRELGVRGLQHWTQAEVKAFLHETDSLRYGVRLSYQRGALPPHFIPVKSLQFGWILESRDGT